MNFYKKGIHMNFRDFLQEHKDRLEPVFFDGGMGTIIQTLQAKDKVPFVDFELKEEVHYHAPDELSITAPELIKAIHSAYLKAGADIITTNSLAQPR
ncbi:MAG: homocysteine S-methyltransferase family protein [Spirochaetaceae bacterium]|nr:homocysteine S-methyltransferase family protein [Spirochaetaceae bacterium]